MNIFIDTETSGLITFDDVRRRIYPSHTKLENYDTARIVSICWIVSQHDKIVEQNYFVIKPDEFIISNESYAIHGISQQEAERTGVQLAPVLKQFAESLAKCKSIVAHNIQFDVNVIMSECFRYNLHDIVALIQSKHHICTMLKGKEFMNVKKYPKLSELYKHLYGEDLVNAHNALADTMYCHKCYIKMFPVDKSIFFFKDKEIRLTDEQQEVVYAPPRKNMLVVAGAGSGKTTTILSRIKHLLDENIEESSIILTTFTWDAAEDLKCKLTDMMGYKTMVKVGTIDGISKFFVLNHASNKGMKHVGEYGHEFLDLIKTKPSLLKQYTHLFIDEFQDINEVQFNIINEFYKNGVTICGIGDDSQNIYSFRGSNVEYILNYQEYFPDSSILMLTTNFRSTKEIVEFANAVNDQQKNSIDKIMLPRPKFNGPKPSVRYFASQGMQAIYIVSKIKDAIDKGILPEEIAVLSPINNSLFSIEELLSKEGINNICLEGKVDVRSNKKPGHVCLCTVHKSKGMEWDLVFLMNISDSIIPKLKNDKNIEDSLRVFYVAITRARKELCMSYVADYSLPYVTRYVSNVPNTLYDFINFNKNYINGVSKNDSIIVEKNIEKIVQMLDGADLQELRNANLIPEFETNIKNVYSKKYDYTNIINTNDLHKEFESFLELIVCYHLCRQTKNTKCLTNANRLLSSLILSPKDFEIYKRYIKYTASAPNKFKATIQSIIEAINTKAQKYDISRDEVPVFSEESIDMIPSTFFTETKDTINIIKREWPVTESILNDLWEISKCKRILQQRRRVLYKDIRGADVVNENSQLISDLIANLNSINNISQLHNEIVYDEITGHIDCIADNTLYLFKVSQKDEVNFSWIMEGFLLSSMITANENIKKISIVNILRGMLINIDIRDWNNRERLIKQIHRVKI